MSKEIKTFTCNNNGFSITFPNGLTLSTRFGYGNYCENRNDELERGLYNKGVSGRGMYESISCNDAEIAVIRDDGKFIKGVDGESVKGNVKIEEWLGILNWCKEHKG